MMSGEACDLLFGGPDAFRDRHSVYRWTEKGIPPTDVVRLISRVGILRDGQILQQVLGFSSRSLHRRLQKSDRQLNPEQSARLFRFAEILAKATLVFGSSEDAQSWIVSPALGLDGDTPLRMLLNPAGFGLVDDFLVRMGHCVYQ